ncbi:YebC/PmpR family DNA-binding transcriptional regulator [Candidatus Saganbacteria bacterium CG08_land_8_20_14_0_20_45_16]|uniref:Probable transcriptional regulatory protein COT42_06525 n=1 Tax=Candidatus Saganbacteria bacterium CG08_land_8_20_14_0_20_45_16 TaxID=2014293 RepID=A0A2H0XY02_UNCSA|nr:MAG: YebC/PmpR family DNA-binding transcriptional regulator [Candidatus Saganbacteria bacterium CG08_land_8_20_14_0_20_45_16]
MSGHSKWATIKHKKAKTDTQRGKIFTKIIREITSAAKQGGGDPGANPRLRLAIDKGKEANMPNDTIERAVAKATGSGDGVSIEEITYEGYGPAGVAIMIEIMTDNKQRTVSEIRNIFSKGGGNMGAAGCVSYLFKKTGSLVFEKGKVSEEELSMAAIDAGAEDINVDDEMIEIVTRPDDFVKVKDALKAKGFTPASAEVSMTPSNAVKVEGEEAKKVIKLVSMLEDHDDVQAVHANFDISADILEQAS